jgi:diguanylate cyclase (GGDEF)-like protein
VPTSGGTKNRSTTEAVFASYGDLAKSLLPTAARLTLYDAGGGLEWSHGDARSDDRTFRTLLQECISGGAIEPKVTNLSDSSVALTLPVVLDSKPIAVLLAQLPFQAGQSERRLLHDIVGTAAPLLDCMCRELKQMTGKAMKSATLAERIDELEWLFALTENLRCNSNEPRAVSQLMGAVVERMKCCFGAVVVPEHGIDLTYESLVHIEIKAAGAFERSRPYFMNFIQRREQSLLSNTASGGTHMPAFKLLVVPIQPRKGKTIGFIAFFKQANKSNFSRRQLFLGCHLGHQIGSLLESQYDLATGLLRRNAFGQDVQRLLLTQSKNSEHSLVYFDIDRLHAINDALGFDAGDEAIVRVADLLHTPALPEDAIACRIGGDNFAVLLPNHDAEQASARAKNVLGLAARDSVGPDEARIPLSMRAGVVRIDSVEAGINGPLANAQMACRTAKEHGGNRVEIYPASTEIAVADAPIDLPKASHARASRPA